MEDIEIDVADPVERCRVGKRSDWMRAWGRVSGPLIWKGHRVWLMSGTIEAAKDPRSLPADLTNP